MISKLMLFGIIILTVMEIYYIYKSYKEAKDIYQKCLYIIIALFIIFPLCIYFLDYYNLPTKLGYTKNFNSQEWLSLIIEYYGSLLAIGLNSIVLVIVTRKQMDDTFKENEKQNKENLRIQNLPLFKYSFTNESLPDENFKEYKHLYISSQKKSSCRCIKFLLDIKNIGLNSARNVFVRLETDILNKPQIFKTSEMNTLEKDESIKNEVMITSVKEGNYKIIVTIIYEDLLKNWYKQNIDLNVHVTRIHENSINTINTYDYRIYEEELINEDTNEFKEIMEKISK